MTIPIGIEFKQSGQAAVLSSLNNIEKGTKKIRASTVAMGNISASALMAGFRKVASVATKAWRDAEDVLKRAKAGEEVSTRFKESGLAAVQFLSEQFDILSERISAAFINSLPDVVLFFRTVAAEIAYIGEFWGATFSNVFKTFKVELDYIASVWNTIFSDPRKWGERFRAAVEIRGQDLANIGGNSQAIQGALNNYNFRMESAMKQYREFQTMQIRGIEPKESKAGAKDDFASAVIRGSVEAVSAINKAKLAQADSIELKQLDTQKQQLIELKRMADAISTYEYIQL